MICGFTLRMLLLGDLVVVDNSSALEMRAPAE
jgi:hypothetical protein